ncbi:hypothetical protein EBN88_05420 [Streptomyces triticirhizae]|uniref:Uncharacterized protein n=1 Tax=Streptomyces triticirhizae TaxID=2483353 RepID=A0A3M2M4G5_9ACTN|nr:hypothetical protein EBN88_05420 [Streptomyces triticirhizae]
MSRGACPRLLRLGLMERLALLREQGAAVSQRSVQLLQGLLHALGVVRDVAGTFKTDHGQGQADGVRVVGVIDTTPPVLHCGAVQRRAALGLGARRLLQLSGGGKSAARFHEVGVKGGQCLSVGGALRVVAGGFYRCQPRGSAGVA